MTFTEFISESAFPLTILTIVVLYGIYVIFIKPRREMKKLEKKQATESQSVPIPDAPIPTTFDDLFGTDSTKSMSNMITTQKKKVDAEIEKLKQEGKELRKEETEVSREYQNTMMDINLKKDTIAKRYHYWKTQLKGIEKMNDTQLELEEKLGVK